MHAPGGYFEYIFTSFVTHLMDILIPLHSIVCASTSRSLLLETADEVADSDSDSDPAPVDD